MTYRKTYLTIILLTGIASINILAHNKEKEPEFKNLKVYSKDISDEDLDKDMHLISRSLGVRCGYCHVRNSDNKWDYAADSLHHKEEARDMMRMTNDLNEKYFGIDLKNTKAADLAINCYTCHRGEEMPIVPWDTASIKRPANPNREGSH